MPAVANCGPCSQFSCEAHRKFKITCNQCREQRYSNCCSFKCSIEIILTQNGDKDAKDYLSNFVNDFLNLSELTASFFSIEISKKTVEKKEQINYVKCYRKSEKLTKCCRTRINFNIDSKVENTIFIKISDLFCNFFGKK